ncbi:MAG TPA: hypothetical protein DIT13_13705 [Verrucomicrobiales bacterium]|nr:hypothetical protein [Verrucomicrobiales bacterium]HRJ10974.1 hypothetical protein [Prosthecobacter sp.]HRK15694.1 hypothetical protein [Prosthecobacter sp.]
MFDPSLPQENTPVDAAQMRAQLTGLKDLIDAVPAITSAVVDAVDTLPPDESATVSVSVTGTVLHLTFGIPQGEQGDSGPPGEVSAQDLADGLETRAHAIPSTGTLDQSAEPEYSPTQAQDIINTLNALITALKGS